MPEIPWTPEDSELESFMDRCVDSFCTWDLLLFLASHPDTDEAADGYAERLGRDVSETEGSLEFLSEQGVLVRQRHGDKTLYRLADDSECLDLLQRFERAQHDRQLRLLMVRKVLKRVEEGADGKGGS